MVVSANIAFMFSMPLKYLDTNDNSSQERDIAE
jgi:hypothetical protein